MLYKFINENSIQACPESGYVNGSAISNLPRYLEKKTDIAKAEGYKPIVVSKEPVFDDKTQYLTVCYEETTDIIIQRWVVNDIEQIDVTTRIAELEAELQSLKEEVQK